MFQDYNQVSQLVNTGFGGLSIFVIGDLMLDRYVWGEVTRISPEAPVPVVTSCRESTALGGAANVALNLARLGLRVTVASVVGADEPGSTLLKLLKESGIDTSPICQVDCRPTTTKTRLFGGHQQMLRLDVENPLPVPELLSREGAAQLLGSMEEYSAVVLSDYNKGVLTEPVCQTAIKVAQEHGIPVLADPKGRHYLKYAGATLLSPNRSELSEVTGESATNLSRLLEAGAELRQTLNVSCLAVTLSDKGIALVESDTTRLFPAKAKEVYDVCGAGDTVIATLAACLAAGLDRGDSIELANLAAGIVVGKVGTSPVECGELARAITGLNGTDEEKVCPLSILRHRLGVWRRNGERIVFTNGCFDILHAGHVSYLESARREGNRLIIGLNSDLSVRALKGPTRPIVPQADRARVLAGLRCVDAIVLFDEETPIGLIEAIRPDVLVKGGDYEVEAIVGAKEVRDWGGQVMTIPLVTGKSTTNLIRAVNQKGYQPIG